MSHEARETVDTTDNTGTGMTLGGLGGAAVGAAAGAIAGPVGAVVGGAIGGAVGVLAGGMAGAAVDNAAVPLATDPPPRGNGGYGADVDTSTFGLVPATTDDSPPGPPGRLPRAQKGRVRRSSPGTANLRPPRS